MIRWLAFLLLTSVVTSSGATEPPTVEEVRYIMGTTAVVQAWADTERQAWKAVEAAYEAFDRVDSLMSTWRDDSVLSSLNRAIPGQWIDVGPETCRVLSVAKEISGISEGAFDPTILPLVEVWGFRGGEVTVPDSSLLEVTLGRVNHELLEVDVDTGRARLVGKEMAVDLGGIAKGYALDIAAEAMTQEGAAGGMLDLGGNLLVFGEGPQRQVGIADPTDPSAILATIPLADESVATSGQYERNLEIQGQKYGHILDPRSGWPVQGGVSVTVVAKEAMIADALATAAVVLGLEKALALLESSPGIEGVFSYPDGKGGFFLRTTSGFESDPLAP
jgi:thiamine biosynthesis lipoprotein